MSKKVGVIAVAAIVILIILGSLVVKRGTQDGGGRSARPSVAVEIDSVRFGPISEKRLITGTIIPQSLYIISPKINGRLTHIYKRIGDPVKPGEVVAKLDNQEYLQALREAEANLSVAKANLIEAESSLELALQENERMNSLVEKGFASPSEVETVKARVEARRAGLHLANAQVESRQAALDLARIRLEYTNLTSSSSGFIGARFADEGALLAPNAPVMSVVNFERVYIKSQLVERDYARIKPGMLGTVTVDAYPNRTFTGKVARIAPLVDQDTRNAEVEMELDNEELLLKPGMFARIELVLVSKEHVLLVPTQAVVSQDGDHGVFVVSRDSLLVHFVPVKVGIVNSDYTEVISPEIQGYVVTLGQHLLAEGSSVTFAGSDVVKGKDGSGGKK